MSQTLTKPILLDETGQAIKTALQNIDETESQDWLLTYEDVHSEMDDNVDRIADALEAIQSIMANDEYYPKYIYISYTGSPSNPVVGTPLDITDITVTALFVIEEKPTYFGSEAKWIDVTSDCKLSHKNGELLGPDNATITAEWTYGKTGITYTASKTLDITIFTFAYACMNPDNLQTMLNAHYADVINLHDYWTVGDTAQVNINGILIDGDTSATTRDATLVILNAGGKELVEPINGHNECAFVLGIKNVISDGWSSATPIEVPYDSNYTDTSVEYTGCWDISTLRTWCNTSFRNSIYTNYSGSSAKSLSVAFKQFKNVTSSDPTGTDIITSNDYFALPAAKEVFGDSIPVYGDIRTITENSELSQFEYYEDDLNKGKKKSDSSAAESTNWAFRTVYKYDPGYGIDPRINVIGALRGEYVTRDIGLFNIDATIVSPFGVI